MLRKLQHYLTTTFNFIRRAARWIKRHYLSYWRKNWWSKVVVIFWAIILVAVGTMYGIAQWYIHSEKSKPLTLGVSFIPDYAEYLGIDPKQTMDALIDDLGVKQFRLVSYWSDIEPTKGHYDFSQLDWQFQKAEAAHAKISLSIGLRQPRWPECHPPNWVDTSQPYQQWLPELKAFMRKTIERYKNSLSLVSYQLENEYFLSAFGMCKNFDRQRLVDEFNFVKKLDPRHTLIVTRSQNAVGIEAGKPHADESGISIYRRVWDQTLTHRYLEYPFPSWYYAFLAGLQKITTGADTIIHEMQAEPWPPYGQPIPKTSLAEQNKSLDAKRLKGRFDYAKATGMKTIDMWGAEYWYYRKEILRDPSVWDVAKVEFQNSN